MTTKLNRSLRAPDPGAGIDRRQLMIGAAGMTFALALSGNQVLAASVAAAMDGNAVNPWVSIALDGTISIMSPATEMGQGSMTSLPRILAEELDADWSRVKIVPAPAIERIYGNAALGGIMYTAGSNAVSNYYKPLREFGAQVRRVLLDNAAKKFAVPVDELTTEPSVVVHAKSGRRLSYGEIAAFAEIPTNAPAVKPEDLKPANRFRLIGKNATRVDLPSKVNGSARYSIDVQIPGMVYGVVLRTPLEGSVIETIDDTKAKAIAGVIQIVRLPYGVGIIAETPWAAFAAKNALAPLVTWTHTGKAVGFDSDKGLDAFAAVVKDPNAKLVEWFKSGDAVAALGQASSVMEAEYRCDYAYHAQMEPLNSVASVSPMGDTVEIWCGTQSQTMATDAAAKAAGVPREKVKLNYLLMGGGFGRRGHRDEEFIVDSVLLSKEAKRPVKVLWTREDDVHNGRFRPMSAHRLRAGFDSAGKLTAWEHRLAADRITPFQDPVRYEQTKGRDFNLMLGVELRSYDIANQLSGSIYQDTGVRTSSLRGIGFTANKFAAEAFLDEIAAKRGIDPVQLRLELLKNTPRGRKVVETAAKMADWGKKREGRGLGFAFVDYSNTLLAGIAEVSIDRATGQIKVHNFWCSQDCGTQVHPDNVLAQTESSIIYGLGMTLSERISFKDGAVEQSNFYDYLVPRMNDVPPMHIELIATDNAPTGVGQMATPLVAPAIANAVAQLTGARLRQTPFTRDRVKKALG